MSIIKGFNHVRLRVDDLEKTVSFYQRVFGFQEIRRSQSPRGSKLVFLEVPNSPTKLEITYFPDSGTVNVQPDLIHLAFDVADMQAFGKHLETLNMQFSDGPTTSSSGTTFAFIDAPEGYEIELIENRD